MPGRAIPLVNEQFYHVFNRGIDRRTTFSDRLDYKRTLLVINYYQYSAPPVKLSKFLTFSREERAKILESLSKSGDKHIEILTFCLMPNHFHLLLRQKRDKGISKFMANFQNSYTRYFNTKNERVGPLFLDQFKAVMIETEEQLLHVSRYIHLNPLTSYVIKEFSDLINYPWTSLPEYLNGRNETCNTSVILNSFKSEKEYLKFIEDQVDYQRELHKIKYLLFE